LSERVGHPAGRLLRRLGLFVVVALVTRAPFLAVRCLDLDEAAHLVGARVLLSGGTPYVDFVDNRPPLVYAYYALAQLVAPGMFPVRLLTALVVLPLTALGASAFFGHDRRGTIAGLLYLVYGAAFLAHDMQSVSCEVLMLLPVAWAAVLARGAAGPREPARLCAAGLLVGVGFLLRQQAVLALPALALAAGPSLAGLLLLGVGFAAPLAATLLVFAARGAAHELVFFTLVHNLRYAANPIPLAEACERAAGSLLPFLLVTAPLWWATRRSLPLLASARERRLVVGLLALSLPAVFVGLRFFPHYFVQLYLPLALGAAPWTAAALQAPVSRAGRAAVAWASLALAGFTVANGVLYSGRVRVYEETRPLFQDVAARLRSDPCYRSGPLFVWGFAPQLYAESALAPATRFIVPQASLTGYVPGNRASRSGAVDTRALVREDHWQLLLGDLARRPPAFLLDTAPSGLHGWGAYPLADFPRLHAFVARGYDAVAIVDGVWIWRRRGCAAPVSLGNPSPGPAR